MAQTVNWSQIQAAGDAAPLSAANRAKRANLQQALINLAQQRQTQQYQDEADQALPGVIMGLGNGERIPPQAPMPGQASVSAQPQSSPQIGDQPPQDFTSVIQSLTGGVGSHQAAQQGGGVGPQLEMTGGGGQQDVMGNMQGYDLPHVVDIIRQRYPNISGGALRSLLTTINPIILTPQARQQLQLLKYQQALLTQPARMMNAEANQSRAETAAANSDMRWVNSYDPTGAPPVRPARPYQPQARSGGGALPVPPSPDQIPQQSSLALGPAALSAANEAMPKGTPNIKPTAGSYAKGRADIARAQSGGRQLGNLAVGEGEFMGIADKAIAASSSIDRSKFLPLGIAQKYSGKMKNDPKWTRLNEYNAGLVRAYARAFGGTVAAQARAEHLLNTATSPENYRVAVETLQDEIKAGKSGAEKVIDGAAGGDPGIHVDGPSQSGGKDFGHLWGE